MPPSPRPSLVASQYHQLPESPKAVRAWTAAASIVGAVGAVGVSVAGAGAGNHAGGSGATGVVVAGAEAAALRVQLHALKTEVSRLRHEVPPPPAAGEPQAKGLLRKLRIREAESVQLGQRLRATEHAIASEKRAAAAAETKHQGELGALRAEVATLEAALACAISDGAPPLDRVAGEDAAPSHYTLSSNTSRGGWAAAGQGDTFPAMERCSHAMAMQAELQQERVRLRLCLELQEGLCHEQEERIRVLEAQGTQPPSPSLPPASLTSLPSAHLRQSHTAANGPVGVSADAAAWAVASDSTATATATSLAKAVAVASERAAAEAAARVAVEVRAEAESRALAAAEAEAFGRSDLEMKARAAAEGAKRVAEEAQAKAEAVAASANHRCAHAEARLAEAEARVADAHRLAGEQQAAHLHAARLHSEVERRVCQAEARATSAEDRAAAAVAHCHADVLAVEAVGRAVNVALATVAAAEAGENAAHAALVDAREAAAAEVRAQEAEARLAAAEAGAEAATQAASREQLSRAIVEALLEGRDRLVEAGDLAATELAAAHWRWRREAAALRIQATWRRLHGGRSCILAAAEKRIASDVFGAALEEAEAAFTTLQVEQRSVRDVLVVELVMGDAASAKAHEAAAGALMRLETERAQLAKLAAEQLAEQEQQHAAQLQTHQERLAAYAEQAKSALKREEAARLDAEQQVEQAARQLNAERARQVGAVEAEWAERLANTEAQRAEQIHTLAQQAVGLEAQWEARVGRLQQKVAELTEERQKAAAGAAEQAQELDALQQQMAHEQSKLGEEQSALVCGLEALRADLEAAAQERINLVSQLEATRAQAEEARQDAAMARAEACTSAELLAKLEASLGQQTAALVVSRALESASRERAAELTAHFTEERRALRAAQEATAADAASQASRATAVVEAATAKESSARAEAASAHAQIAHLQSAAAAREHDLEAATAIVEVKALGLHEVTSLAVEALDRLEEATVAREAEVSTAELEADEESLCWQEEALAAKEELTSAKEELASLNEEMACLRAEAEARESDAATRLAGASEAAVIIVEAAEREEAQASELEVKEAMDVANTTVGAAAPRASETASSGVVVAATEALAAAEDEIARLMQERIRRAQAYATLEAKFASVQAARLDETGELLRRCDAAEDAVKREQAARTDAERMWSMELEEERWGRREEVALKQAEIDRQSDALRLAQLDLVFKQAEGELVREVPEVSLATLHADTGPAAAEASVTSRGQQLRADERVKFTANDKITAVVTPVTIVARSRRAPSRLVGTPPIDEGTASMATSPAAAKPKRGLRSRCPNESLQA